MGIFVNGHNDAFVSYAHDDNTSANKIVDHFCMHLTSLLRVEARRQGHNGGSDVRIFQDVTGLARNGRVSNELRKEVLRSEFLVIFVGQSYPSSYWCGQELKAFAEKFGNDRSAAIERTFIAVIEPEAMVPGWSDFLESPDPAITRDFFDKDTGETFEHIVVFRGKGEVGPLFHREVKEIAKAIVERAS